MPGLNKQGPDGTGPASGRQKGMCRRTDELSLRGRRDGQGRGMGGRCKGSFFQAPVAHSSVDQATTKTDTAQEFDELSTLHDEYQKTQLMLEKLIRKIEALEEKKRSET